MSFNFFRLFLAIFFISAATFAAQAQVDSSNQTPNSNQKEEVPKGIQETLAKQRIEREKKDFADLLQRGEEALKITNELEESFEKNNNFSSEDQKKLDRLEKVVKKIRTELGSDDADEVEEKPLSVLNALKNLQSNTVKLVDELKKTTRYSISVVAVESSNALLNLVRFLRFRKN
jgi:flagellar motor protein MotB